jgi:hypothetical protein
MGIASLSGDSGPLGRPHSLQCGLSTKKPCMADSVGTLPSKPSNTGSSSVENLFYLVDQEGEMWIRCSLMASRQAVREAPICYSKAQGNYILIARLDKVRTEY